MKNRIIFIAVILIIVAGIFYWKMSKNHQETAQNLEYNPVINPDDFTSEINNRYFSLKNGSKFVYERKTGEDTEKIEVEVIGGFRKIMAVGTIEVRSRAWLNDQLTEDVRYWYIQDKNGNVWYFGKATDNYENGKVKDHKGSWEAGIDGAKPGIIMEADPKIGDLYKQEYYKGKLEDMAEVVGFAKEVVVNDKTFTDCLQIKDWSAIETNAEKYKYYCPETKAMVLETSIDNQKRLELVSVSEK